MVDNATGDVIAIVGGRDYTDQLGFNRAANGKRPPGSVAKPLIVYGPALESGRFSANSVFDDSTSGWPVNYDNKYRGPVTVRDAIRLSINTVAVKAFNATGAAYCCDFARDKMGLNVANNYPANALGAFEATPTEIAIAYSAFANNGMRNKPRCVTKITDIDNRILMEPPVQSLRAMKETTAVQMTDMLRTVVTSGTGTNARIGSWYICGKTGTTSLPEHLGGIKGNPDAWFAGYSPYYTCAVWMGYDETDRTHYLYNEYGGNKPCRIWKAVMTSALEDKEVSTKPLTGP
jgi:penicillin-binding protein 1A